MGSESNTPVVPAKSATLAPKAKSTAVPYMDQVAKRVNAVSKSFCLAKWYQVTLHLQNGHNHSCHHPRTHKTPLEELEFNPAALHNTDFKKRLRKMMLEGKRPQECSFCWKIEDLPNAPHSDRILKSGDHWAYPYLEEAAKTPWTEDVIPRYLEVAFSSTCNFKCSYCNPSTSTYWEAELKEMGPYWAGNHVHSLESLKNHQKEPIAKEEDNPYIEAFWKWLPTIYKELLYFRVTGGEPLLSPNTFKLLQYAEDHPNKNLRLAINSNLNAPKARIEKLLQHTTRILDKNLTKSVTIYTSLEAWGKQAEYIRFGLDVQKFWENVTSVLDSHPDIQLHFMGTFNIFCMESFRPFLECLLDLRTKYKPKSSEKNSRFFLDVGPLTNPPFLSSNIATPDLLQRMKSDMVFMEKHSKDTVDTFMTAELNRLQRAYAYASEAPPDAILAKNRADFFTFIREHDRRRNVDFLSTFPSYEKLFKIAKDTALKELHTSHVELLTREKAALEQVKLAQLELAKSRHALALSFENKKRIEVSIK